MKEELRKTGIDIIGDIPWSTHFCQFYQTKEDLIDILVPYFKAGLGNNEFCMWVTSEPLSEEEVNKAMREALPDFDQYLKRGQIEIIPHTEWYLKNGVFNSQRVLNGWVDKLQQALAKGYDGLRLTGNTFWLEQKDWRKFADYEEEINNVIGKYRMIVICTYSLDKCGSMEVIDVVRNHQFALIKREGKWDLIESSDRKRAVDALQRSEEKFRTIFEQSPIAIELYDLNGQLVDANKACLEMFGVSDAEEMKGFKLFDDPNLSDEVKERLKKGENVRYEAPFNFEKVREHKLYKTTKSGAIYLDVVITSLGPREKEKQSGYLVQVQDITKRRKAEEALRKVYDELEIRIQERTAELIRTNELLERVFSSIDLMIAYMDKDFNFIRVNRAYAEADGREPDFYVGKNHFALFPNKENEAIFRKVVETGEPYFVYEKPFSYAEHPERGVTYWDWSLHTVKKADGSVGGVVLSLVNVTKRKRAEEALKAASLYARSLIEASLDPLVTISADGKVMDVNSATELVTGVSRKQLIGTDFSDYFTEPEKSREGYEQVFLKGFVRDYPLTIRHTSGRLTDVLYNATVFKDEAGKMAGVFAAARDITERNEIQNRIQATNALLNTFVRKFSRREYLEKVVDLIQGWSDCRCVGVRVLDERGNIPYESYLGFGREFWESENFLSIKNGQCACIRVVTGELDPQDAPVVTPGGSFCCGNTIKFTGGLSEEEKSRYRGVCVQNGFLSVAIIPVRYMEKILGAIHLADEMEGKVSFKALEFIESIAPLIGEAVNRFNLEEELRESENRLRHLSSQLLTVQENERKRISREIHDSLGQSLTAIKFRVENTLQQMDKGKAKTIIKPLEDIIPIIQESIEEARRIQMDLRPSILDDLGVQATLSWFSREFQKTYTTISIEKKIDIQESEVPDALKTVLYRISQEALNNIAKHSKADLVHLTLKKINNSIELTIQDNGEGFDPREALAVDSSKRGLGLTGMRERAELSGGMFFIESTVGKGTLIRASWTL
jgi:PAS domain S-box-containing protein